MENLVKRIERGHIVRQPCQVVEARNLVKRIERSSPVQRLSITPHASMNLVKRIESDVYVCEAKGAI